MSTNFRHTMLKMYVVNWLLYIGRTGSTLTLIFKFPPFANLVAGKLKGLEVGKVRRWEGGKLGGWETERIGSWEGEKVGRWETNRAGSWEAGKLGNEDGICHPRGIGFAFHRAGRHTQAHTDRKRK